MKIESFMCNLEMCELQYGVGRAAPYSAERQTPMKKNLLSTKILAPLYPKSLSSYIPNSNSDVDFHTCIAVQEMNFKTAMGRAVYNIVFHPPKSAAAETFQPRRTAFLFDMDDIGYGLGIPTTLRRSKGDCPKVCPLVESLGHYCRVYCYP